MQIIAKAIGRIARQKVRIVLNQNFQPRTGQNNGELNSVTFHRGVNLGFSMFGPGSKFSNLDQTTTEKKLGATKAKP